MRDPDRPEPEFTITGNIGAPGPAPDDATVVPWQRPALPQPVEGGDVHLHVHHHYPEAGDAWGVDAIGPYVDIPPDRPYREPVRWHGMTGRAQLSGWSIASQCGKAFTFWLAASILLIVGARWLTGQWCLWIATLPAAVALVWLVLVLRDGVKYTLRGGPPPPL